MFIGRVGFYDPRSSGAQCFRQSYACRERFAPPERRANRSGFFPINITSLRDEDVFVNSRQRFRRARRVFPSPGEPLSHRQSQPVSRRATVCRPAFGPSQSRAATPPTARAHRAKPPPGPRRFLRLFKLLFDSNIATSIRRIKTHPGFGKTRAQLRGRETRTERVVTQARAAQRLRYQNLKTMPGRVCCGRRVSQSAAHFIERLGKRLFLHARSRVIIL